MVKKNEVNTYPLDFLEKLLLSQSRRPAELLMRQDDSSWGELKFSLRPEFEVVELRDAKRWLILESFCNVLLLTIFKCSTAKLETASIVWKGVAGEQ